jgi:hypothetical protein
MAGWPKAYFEGGGGFGRLSSAGFTPETRRPGSGILRRAFRRTIPTSPASAGLFFLDDTSPLSALQMASFQFTACAKWTIESSTLFGPSSSSFWI